jgi:hypothetical protein
MSLAEWCGMVRRLAHSLYGDQRVYVHYRRYRVNDLAPLAMLQARLALSPDATRWVLRQRPDLVAALGCNIVPGLERMRVAGVMLRRMKSRQAGVATRARAKAAEAVDACHAVPAA